MNRFSIEFLNKIKEYFEFLPFDIKGKNLCVCLSGGADSVSLLRALNILSEELQISLSACHFNHMIRGTEADNDEKFCKELCDKFGVKIYCGRDDVPLFAKTYKLSVEEAARKCRYAFFERISSKYHIDYCLTAHNMNDDAETLLLNIIRGSGSYGASSISLNNGYILRPLLKVSRQQIEDFLSDIDQDFVTDSTNLSLEYTRNFIRHILVPEIEKINPAAIVSLSRFADSAREDREYFETLVNENLETDLRTLPAALRHRIYIKKFKDASGKSLNFDLISLIDKLVFQQNRSIKPIYSEYEVIVSDGKVKFLLKEENNQYDFESIELNDGNNLLFNGRVDITINEKTDDVENFNKISISEILSSDNIVGTVKARTRMIGDKILIHGVNKSLKKLFIDKKIPKEYRQMIPVVYDDEGIIYVPFVGISDRAFNRNANKTLSIKTVFNCIEKERWINAYEK